MQEYKVKSRNVSRVLFNSSSLFFYISYEINGKIKSEKIIFDDIEEFNVFIIKNSEILKDISSNQSLLTEMYTIIYPKNVDLPRKIAVEALTKEFFGTTKISSSDFLKNFNNLSMLLFFNYITAFYSGRYQLLTMNTKIILRDAKSIIGIFFD